ncbi:hypothetical protein BDF20DRAFT_833234 [Mycotypha africana]|uniref:uncharacterized protein n=1 Tax=Mycotypha africana TaxID=64632 RepID=UPI0023001E33|nr:uncharacterized protein BDF20DRAFT_833234 [Mycotypha africana]KAI8988373.1 hypothetical protein BDF20DRAFT_833234 [Mycotypha africana]
MTNNCNNFRRLPVNNASAPSFSSGNENNISANTYYYQYPQQTSNHNNTDCITAPPPYDTMSQYQYSCQPQAQQQQLSLSTSPTPTPSTSWTSEMNALAQKIKDDVTKTFLSKSSKKTLSSSSISNTTVDRHSISQGMKLVSIAADEYESGNEAVALGVYLTGVDKILMALPNKTDTKTKLAIKKKLQSVEERVGLFAIANLQKASNNDHNTKDASTNITVQVQSLLLSRLTHTISTITNKAYQKSSTTAPSTTNDNANCESSKGASRITTSTTHMHDSEQQDSMVRFKRLGQYMIDFTVACAIIIKKSPIPGILSFFFGYMVQIFLWMDAQYHVIHKAQNFSIRCLKFGLEADEKYRLHEFIAEGFYMLFAAGLKAAIAYKETPCYTYESNIAANAASAEPDSFEPTSSYVCTDGESFNNCPKLPAETFFKRNDTLSQSWTRLFNKNSHE